MSHTSLAIVGRTGLAKLRNLITNTESGGRRFAGRRSSRRCPAIVVFGDGVGARCDAASQCQRRPDREGRLTRTGLELLMIEEPGCAYCARWMREVAPGYKKSSEGSVRHS